MDRYCGIYSKERKASAIGNRSIGLEDVERAVEAIKKYDTALVLMQCNTNYTAEETNFSHINLRVLSRYQKAFPDCILGLSDHTYGHTTVLGAYALGARVFEKHFTDDNGREGPDHKFSMNPETWKAMVKACHELEEAMGMERSEWRKMR